MREEIKIRLLKALLEEVSRKYDQLLREKEELLKQAYERAVRDPITGLYNRYYLEDFLLRLIGRRRREKHGFSVAFIDLDNFKNVNDLYGHSEGDNLLKMVAKFFLNNLRDYDIVARIGGDEFLIVFESPVSVERIEELRSKFENTFRAYQLSFSFGLVHIDEVFDEDLTDKEVLEKLIDKADERMYKDKVSKDISQTAD